MRKLRVTSLILNRNDYISWVRSVKSKEKNLTEIKRNFIKSFVFLSQSGLRKEGFEENWVDFPLSTEEKVTRD